MSYRFGIDDIFFILVVLTCAIIAFLAFYWARKTDDREAERHERFMLECLADHKEYECEALLRHCTL